MVDDVPMGAPHTTLVVIRDNSGSGKSSVARRSNSGTGQGVLWSNRTICVERC